MAVLQLHSAHKSFRKKEVLTNVSFTLETGDIMGIFGRNGSGKSTLMKMMFGTLKADHLIMSLDGNTIASSNVIAEKNIGYIPQHPFLPKYSKVRDLIPMYFSSEKQQDALFYDPFIAKIAAKKVNSLSLGESKYLEVLLIGNQDHPFLIMDEPFSMVDPLQKEAIKEFLKTISTSKGIIITDHYYNDVLDITSKNIVIKDGESFAVKHTEDLKKMEYLSRS